MLTTSEFAVLSHPPRIDLPGLQYQFETIPPFRVPNDADDTLRLARLVRAASVASEDEAEFVRRLRRAGVLARPRYAAGGRERVVGYSGALRPADGAEPGGLGGGH